MVKLFTSTSKRRSKIHKQRIKMKEQKSYAFCKLYKGLMMAFGLPESAFMAYMADLYNMRKAGYNTVRSVRNHISCLGIGRYAFDKCVEKTERMGLLKRVAVDGKYDYIWDMKVYDKLLQIVSVTSSYVELQTFCKKVFDDEKRSVLSITWDEIEELSEK